MKTLTTGVYAIKLQELKMTREEFCKIKFKAYTGIEYRGKEYLLKSVDFDTEILELTDLDNFQDRCFPIHISQVSIPRPKLKLSKKTTSN